MTQQYNLFGGLDEIKKVEVTPLGRKKYPPTKANGYAGIPGTGPEGETCGSCGNHLIREGNCNRFHKCYLLKGRLTKGTGTDIRVRSPACSFWVKDEDKE